MTASEHVSSREGSPLIDHVRSLTMTGGLLNVAGSWPNLVLSMAPQSTRQDNFALLTPDRGAGWGGETRGSDPFRTKGRQTMG